MFSNLEMSLKLNLFKKYKTVRNNIERAKATSELKKKDYRPVPLFLFFASIFSFKIDSVAVRRLNKIISFAPHANDQPLHYRCTELRMHPVF